MPSSEPTLAVGVILLPQTTCRYRAPRTVLLVTVFMVWVLSASGQAGASGAGETSGPHPDGRSRAAVSTRAMPTVDAVIQQAISDGNIPGAVLVVGHNGNIIYRKAYGSRALEPRREAMTLDTVFDLASRTKVVATNTA